MRAISPYHVEAELIRGITARTLMQRGCLCLASGSLGPDVKQRWYDLSRPAQRLTHFLSHSWQDSRFDKALALMLYNSLFTIYSSTSLIVLIVALVQGFGLLPLPMYSFRMDGVLSTNGVSCFVCGCLTWFLALASSCVHGGGAWFLDKACICQHDQVLKQQGILALGCFLERSERMVILLSPRYFVRGWCAFEVATFLGHRDLQAVDIVPLLRARMVTVTFLLNMLGLTIFHVCTSLKISELEGGEVYSCFAIAVPHGLVLGCMSYLVERYLQEQKCILQQVAGFRFADAKFTEEADRDFVSRSIVTLFGSVDSFESVVRTEVLDKVTQTLGDDRLPLRYEAIILGTLPYLWWGIDMLCTDAPQFKLIDIVFGCLFTVSVLPTMFVMVVELVRFKLRLLGAEAAGWTETAASIGIFTVTAVLTTISTALTLIGAQIYLLPTGLLWVAVSVACFAPRCRRSGASGSPELISQREA